MAKIYINLLTKYLYSINNSKKDNIVYYIFKNEILRNIDEIKCIIIFIFYIFTVKFFFTEMKQFFCNFTGLLPDYFLQ